MDFKTFNSISHNSLLAKLGLVANCGYGSKFMYLCITICVSMWATRFLSFITYCQVSHRGACHICRALVICNLNQWSTRVCSLYIYLPCRLLFANDTNVLSPHIWRCSLSRFNWYSQSSYLIITAAPLIVIAYNLTTLNL